MNLKISKLPFFPSSGLSCFCWKLDCWESQKVMKEQFDLILEDFKLWYIFLIFEFFSYYIDFASYIISLSEYWSEDLFLFLWPIV